MRLNQDKQCLSIRQIILVIFVLTFIIGAGMIIYLNNYSWKKSIDKTIVEYVNNMNNEIIREIDDMVSIPIKMNENNQFMIKNEIIDINNSAEREPFLANIVNTSIDEIYSVSYGLENGDFYGARRNSNNELELYQSTKETKGHSLYYSVNENLTAEHLISDFGLFDPRTRDWYIIAKEKGEPVFAPLYKHFVKEDLVLSAAYPIYKNDIIQGVLGVHLTLNRLNSNLKKLVEKTNTKAYIIEADGQALVANSMEQSNFTILEDGTYDRRKLEDIADSSIMKAFELYENENTSLQLMNTENDKFHINITDYQKHGLQWSVIISVPEQLFMKDNSLLFKISMMLLFLIIIVSIYIFARVSKHYLKPVNDLVQAADSFSKGDLTKRAIIYRNDEIGSISKSFNHLADKIQSLINNLEDKVAERTKELEAAVTELKKVNKNLSLEKNRAEAASIAKSQFLANMSHEIRTPMNGIIGFLQLLDDSPLNEEQKEYIQLIQSSTDTLLTVINDVLDISKIETGMMKLESIPFHLTSLIETAVTLFGTRAKEKGLELNLMISSQVPYNVIGDPTRIRQVLNNLINNAIKFTESGEVYVEVSLVKENEQEIVVLCKVKDTGIGINKSDINKLFRPFSQVDTSMTRKYGGSGLGLSICKKIADLMGGDIKVISKKKKGSTFSFTFPLLKNEKATALEISDYAILKDKKILIIDDVAMNRYIAAAYLTEFGCMVAEAKSNDYAQILHNKAQNNDFYDVILIDYRLNETTGFDVLHKIKGSIKTMNTAFVLITTIASNQEAEGAGQIGFEGFITKPYKKVELLDCIAVVLGEKELMRNDPIELITKHKIRESRYNDRLKILLVEDNVINTKFFIKLINKHNLFCDVAKNGLEAVKACDMKQYDLIFMDCQMPIMDGYEATKQIRAKEKSGKHTIIIAMTAFAMSGDAEKCMEVGMDDYLSKPIIADQLMDLINKYSNKIFNKESSNDDDDYFEKVIKQLREDTDFSHEDAEEIIIEFRDHALKTVETIKQLFEDGKIEEVQLYLHQLKGSAGNVRAKEIASLVEDMEKHLKKDVSIAEINNVLESILSKVKQLFVKVGRS
ncbi:response regulator [Mobilitalea sibirica]|uniref:Circadian input-output histidine kinase CikA n=1 Tax=Mobilitalea sibirica TaxID=1462919 RepID=A0A8J7H0I7_9FIRM|nr:response regulator [Mobilitalea sibirica]MBH1939587.1 response regulator [Mobilitalea sibirica]